MKKMLLFLYLMWTMLLLANVTGCSSTGYSGSTGYYHDNHRNSWNYDTYYRSGVNRNSNRAAASVHVRSGGGRAGSRGRR